MTDQIDAANETAERYRSAALANRASDGPVPCGYCHYCGEPLPADQRWCDTDCRDGWQAEQDAAERRGMGDAR